MNRCLFVLMVLVAGCGPVVEKAAPGAEKKVPPVAEKKVAYPYPECEAIVEAMKSGLGDPKSLEVIEWGELKPSPDGFGHQNGSRRIRVKFRAANKFGGAQIQELDLYVSPSGEISAESTVIYTTTEPPHEPIAPKNVKGKLP